MIYFKWEWKKDSSAVENLTNYTSSYADVDKKKLYVHTCMKNFAVEGVESSWVVNCGFIDLIILCLHEKCNQHVSLCLDFFVYKYFWEMKYLKIFKIFFFPNFWDGF